MISPNQATTQVVKIDTVDLANNNVHCSSKDGGRFVIKVPISNGFYRIPQSGEHWIVRRQDLTNWYFEGVVVGENVYGSSYPQEGDIILSSPNNVNISANALFVNNHQVGIWDYEEFVLEEESDTIVLSGAPASSAIQVFNNGLLIAPSGIVIGEQTLLFKDPLSTGIVVVYYTRVPSK